MIGMYWQPLAQRVVGRNPACRTPEAGSAYLKGEIEESDSGLPMNYGRKAAQSHSQSNKSSWFAANDSRWRPNRSSVLLAFHSAFRIPQQTRDLMPISHLFLKAILTSCDRLALILDSLNFSMKSDTQWLSRSLAVARLLPCQCFRRV